MNIGFSPIAVDEGRGSTTIILMNNIRITTISVDNFSLSTVLVVELLVFQHHWSSVLVY